MEISIDNKKIVSAIQRGLTNTKIEIYSSNTLTNNRKHMEKWDNINTSLKKIFERQEKYSFIPLNRGFFTPILIYDNEEKILYTIMKSKNFTELLKRDSIKKIHYLDALLDYNLPHQKAPAQMSMFNRNSIFSDVAETQINDLKCDIESLLGSSEIKKYITIVIEFNGYTLTSVEAVLCSKWLEIIETDNWSELITPLFDDIEENGKNEVVQDVEIKSKISLKPTLKKVKIVE